MDNLRVLDHEKGLGITVGCEIEFAVDDESQYELELELNEIGEIKDEGSVNPDYEWHLGLEFNSMVLHPEMNIVEYLMDVCNVLGSYDAYSDPWNMCGTHIHIGVSKDGTPVLRHKEEWLEKIILNWFDWGQKEFLWQFDPCEERMDEWAMVIESGDLDMGFAPEDWLPSRSCSLNFCSLIDNNTIEFRLFDGTINEYEIMRMINWCAAFVKYSILTDTTNEAKDGFMEALGITLMAPAS